MAELGATQVKKSDRKIYLVLILFGIVVIGGMAATAYYGEEVGVFLQGGWNRRGMEGMAKDFIAHVQQGKYQEALQLVHPSELAPLEEDGQIVGMKGVDPSGMNPEQWEFATLFPSSEPKLTSVEWSTIDGGAFIVSLIFPEGKETRFLIRRMEGDFKIVSFLGIA